MRSIRQKPGKSWDITSREPWEPRHTRRPQPSAYCFAQYGRHLPKQERSITSPGANANHPTTLFQPALAPLLSRTRTIALSPILGEI